MVAEEILSTYLQATYPIMELFYSLQGEGYWMGSAAFFVRLGGCDVNCFWCDVPESWGATYPRLATEHILQELLQKRANRVIITGGEPTLHNLLPLTTVLRQHKIKAHLETAGNHDITGIFDWICLSPKKFSPPLLENYQRAHELKVVVQNRHDLVWAEQQAQHCPVQTIKYLQPEWANFEKVSPWVVAYIQENPTWRLSLQIHKYLNIR